MGNILSTDVSEIVILEPVNEIRVEVVEQEVEDKDISYDVYSANDYEDENSGVFGFGYLLLGILGGGFYIFSRKRH